MAQHGGPRTPAQPAAVSNPGAGSARTDGRPGQPLRTGSGLPYGDREALMAQERTAPMAQAPTVTAPPVTAPAGPAQQAAPVGPPPPPFNAPTTRPNEPITHGVNHGPGGGTEVLPTPPAAVVQAQGPMTKMLAGLAQGGMSGDLAALYQAASTRGV